jgi:hypothetical protein
VGERRGAEEHVVSVQVQRLVGEVLRVRTKPAVRQLDALRRAGRPRRVEDDCDVVSRSVRDLREGRPVELVLDDCARARVGDPLAALALAQERVDRDDDGAEAERSVVGGDKRRPVREDDGDAVAGLDSLCAQRARGACGERVQPGVVDRAAVVQQRRA